MGLNVIAGFKEALTSMAVGSKWKLFVPSELAYKESRRSAKLGPNSTLIFELELTGLKDLPPPPNPAARGAKAGSPRAVSPPVRVPQPGKGARAVSPPVRVPARPGEQKRTEAVTPPVRIPTNPQPKPDPDKTPTPAPGKK